MEIRIVPVTARDREKVLALSVRREQQGFIETTAQCLCEAQELPLWRPVGLWYGEDLVGFAMYGRWEDGRVWLDRFLIDSRFQGRSLGSRALDALLEQIPREYGCKELYLSIFDGNRRAEGMYRARGFVPNGERDTGGEQVLVKRYEA